MVPLRQVAARAEASAAAGTDGDPRMLKEFQEFVARGNVMDDLNARMVDVDVVNLTAEVLFW